MRKTLFALCLLIASAITSELKAQVVDLPDKINLSSVLLDTPKIFSSSTTIDTLKIPFATTGDYSLEVKTKITVAEGRGLDIEVRNPLGKGFRTSLNPTSYTWSTPLNSLQPISSSDNTDDHVFRFAVSDGLVHIFQDGNYLTSKSTTKIKDIDAEGNETEPSVTLGAEIIGSQWAGSLGVLPTTYGWTADNTSIPWSTGGGGVRYEDITNTVDGGTTYTGRVLTIRWDNATYLNATYFYPVTLEANTSYDFSLLYEYWANSSNSVMLNVGISTSKNAADIYESTSFTTSPTAQVLREGHFQFSTKDAGQYYLAFSGNWAMYAIGRLQLQPLTYESRILLGKNYPNGTIDMEVSSVTMENEAYKPTAGSAPATIQNIMLTGSLVTTGSYLNTNITISGKTDLHLRNTNPLINSTVNLNSQDAWLFFDHLKPSEVINNWLDKVKVNGENATNEGNVRVVIYGSGSVIVPNFNNALSEPLTLFTEADFGGNSHNYAVATYKDLGEFDNKAASMKLKRGYMLTLANNPDGTGYSRVFIADQEDLNINLPDYLAQRVSFIRLMKYEWVAKKGWCQTGSEATTNASKVNASWFYTWSADQSSSSDKEYVPIRQTQWWPGYGEISNLPNSRHVLGFNEPDRPDQANMSVAQAVDQWPEFMKTGLRIGSPAPSDPWNNWLKDFINGCDDKGYRVDFVAIHCYWGGKSAEQWYTDLKAIWEKYGKRPLWITEWNNGANWTTESGWPDDPSLLTNANAQKQLSDLQGILQVMDTAHFVERYAIYNWVEPARSIIYNGDLTPAGEYYASNTSQIAYQQQNNVIPSWKMPAAPTLSDTIQDDNIHVGLYWNDLKDELVNTYLERKQPGESDFTTVAEIVSGTTNYFDEITALSDYRLRIEAAVRSEVEYSNTVTVELEQLPAAPTSLTCEVKSATSVHMNWSTVDRARTYNLKRSTTQDGTYETILSNTTDLEFEDTGLLPATIYYYKLSASNYAGEGDDSTPVAVTTNNLAAPSSVTGETIAFGDAEVKLKWNFQYDAVYNVKRSESESGPFSSIATALTDTIYIDNTVNNGSTYYYVITAENDIAESDPSNLLKATPGIGQHAYWTLDERSGLIAHDKWGGFNGELESDGLWAENGKFGSAVSFDGIAGSYLKIADGAVSSLNDFTISCWVKLTQSTANSRIFDFGSGTATFMMFCPNYGDNQIRYKITYGGQSVDLKLPYTFSLNTWTHIAITQSGSTLKIYADGELLGSTNTDLTPSGMGITTDNYLGKSQWPNDPILNGSIDDFRIYNYGMSIDEISTLFSELVTATNDLEMNSSGIIVYPNPVSDILYINGDCSHSAQLRAEIFGLKGQKVLDKIIGSLDHQSIQVAHLIKGVYIIKIRDENKITSQRFIKQ